MIIANATITFIATTGGGFDEETGLPIVVSTEKQSQYGQVIPVYINNIAHSEGGIIKQAKYKILLDTKPLLNAKRLEIESEEINEGGAFAIISINYLRAVEQWEVLV